MVLSWHLLPPKPNPFNAAVGDDRKYIVHFSESESKTDDSIQQDISECLGKAVDLLKENLAANSAYFLIEWDVVYCIMTVVVTDQPMEDDCINVVKCQFIELDKISNQRYLEDESFDTVTNELTSTVKRWSSEFVKNSQTLINSNLEVKFHSESRENSVPL